MCQIYEYFLYQGQNKLFFIEGFMRKYGSRKQKMVQNSYLTDTQWVLLVSSLGCIIENGQKMERKGGSSVTKSFDKR